MNTLRMGSILTTDKIQVDVVKADPTDNKFLACALEAEADAVVSGDLRHLLPLKSFQGIPIITPHACVERIVKQQQAA